MKTAQRSSAFFQLLPTLVVAFCSTVSAIEPMELGHSSLTYIEDQTTKSPSFKGWDPLAADTPWFREFHRDVSADPVDPNSDVMLSRMVKANGILDAQWSGGWTNPAWSWYTTPIQVVPGTVTPVTLPGTWAYTTASSGPYLLPPEPVVFQGGFNYTYQVEPWAPGDHHMFVFVRDEATGGPKELWEYYQLRVVRNGLNQISSINGASWRKFDLVNGENPSAGTITTDAAGLPFSPLLVRYDEVATGAINHVIRFALNNSDIAPTYKWPARTSAAAWNLPTGMPYGTRLRLKKSWWDANANTVLGTGTQAHIIGEAMRKYGLILADGSGGSSIQIHGIADLRWTADMRPRLAKIPVSAFEVVSTPPMLEITGPKTLRVGDKGTWIFKVSSLEPSIGSGTNINILLDSTRIQNAWTKVDEQHRTVSADYQFNKPGTYQLKPFLPWSSGMGAFYVTVVSTSNSNETGQPAAGLNPTSGLRAWPNPKTPNDPFIKFFNVAPNSEIEIIDSQGGRVVMLHSDQWDGKNADGQRAASGVYLALVTATDGKKDRIKLLVVW